MDLVVELKINNPDDWTLIEGLLKRLKVSFSKKTLSYPQFQRLKRLLMNFTRCLMQV